MLKGGNDRMIFIYLGFSEWLEELDDAWARLMDGAAGLVKAAAIVFVFVCVCVSSRLLCYSEQI